MQEKGIDSDYRVCRCDVELDLRVLGFLFVAPDGISNRSLGRCILFINAVGQLHMQLCTIWRQALALVVQVTFI